MEKTKVWDPLVRIVHWLLALSILGAALTADRSSWLTAHVYFGSATVVLAMIRLLWGLVGTRYARFKDFMRGPRSVLDYARRMARLEAPRILGHNPVAGWVMMGMLLLLLPIALTGLGALGGQEQIGPLSGWLGFEAGHFAKELHEGLSGFLGFAVGLHLAGIALHMLLHRENIVRSMITGRKRVHPDDIEAPARPHRGMTWRVVLSILPALALGPWLLTLPTDYRAPTTQSALAGEVSPAARTWRRECGSCHFAIPPELMPDRSWRYILATLEDHYGKDAWLPDKTRRRLEAHAVAHNADRIPTKAGHRLWRDMNEGATPLSIIHSHYWKSRHKKIDAKVYLRPEVGSRLNCGACHRLALQGSFEDADVAIPPVSTPYRIAQSGIREFTQ